MRVPLLPPKRSWALGWPCGISAIETFATGLAMGQAALRAALTEPWSNGQAKVPPAW